MILSIAIPSYDRPDEILRLLNSIDLKDFKDFEVVICEDYSKSRNEIREAIYRFKEESEINIQYFENNENFGYDRNIIELLHKASGEFVLFMGDDDYFNEGVLKKYIDFLKKNRDVGYVLRSYLSRNPVGYTEEFRYLKNEKYFEPGVDTVLFNFKRSVSLAGFTISREKALPYTDCALIEGTLLTQIYLMSEVCLRYKSIYCPLLTAYAHQSYRDNEPKFGNSEKEKARYVPGSISQNNSINFTKSYFEIAQFLESRNNIKIEKLIRRELSKYSYPFLSIQRNQGFLNYLSYTRKLEKECNLNITWHYYFYKFSLLIFGERLPSFMIFLVKKFLGYSPTL